MKIPLIIISLACFACESINKEFNPFDNEFRIHQNFIRDEYDTIIGQCGYWNLTKQIDGLEIYYQYFADEPEIVAKGFSFMVNELRVNSIDSETKYDSLITILNSAPIDTTWIASQLTPLGVSKIEILNKEYANVKIIDNNNTTHSGCLASYMNETESRLMYCISYFNGKR